MREALNRIYFIGLFAFLLLGMMVVVMLARAQVLDGVARPKVMIVEPITSTLLPPADPERFSFAVMGDSQRFEENDTDGGLQRAVLAIAAKNPDFVMTVGDQISNCSGGLDCAEKHEAWKRVMLPILHKTFEVMGNHDRSSLKESDILWQDAFNLPVNGPVGYSELVYSFDYGNSHFIVLNTEAPDDHKINGDQRDWLEKDLQANLQKNVFVFFHQPAYPMGPKRGSSLDVHEKNRDELWEIIDKYNVTAVFNGHEHVYSRKTIDQSLFEGAKNNVYQINAGHVDASDRKAPDELVADKYYVGNVFLMVNVVGDQVTVEARDLEGQIMDAFTFKG